MSSMTTTNPNKNPNKATGTYYGAPFAGAVVSSRQHTCAPFAMLYTVRFDSPVCVPFIGDPVDRAIIQDCYAAGDGEGCAITVSDEEV